MIYVKVLLLMALNGALLLLLAAEIYFAHQLLSRQKQRKAAPRVSTSPFKFTYGDFTKKDEES